MRRRAPPRRRRRRRRPCRPRRARRCRRSRCARRTAGARRRRPRGRRSSARCARPRGAGRDCRGPPRRPRRSRRRGAGRARWWPAAARRRTRRCPSGAGLEGAAHAGRGALQLGDSRVAGGQRLLAAVVQTELHRRGRAAARLRRTYTAAPATGRATTTMTAAYGTSLPLLCAEGVAETGAQVEQEQPHGRSRPGDGGDAPSARRDHAPRRRASSCTTTWSSGLSPRAAPRARPPPPRAGRRCRPGRRPPPRVRRRRRRRQGPARPRPGCRWRRSEDRGWPRRRSLAPPCRCGRHATLSPPGGGGRPPPSGENVQSISQRSPPQLMRQSPGLMRRRPRPAVTTSSTPSRKARCMAQTRSGSAPESSRKVQLLTTTSRASSRQATSGRSPCSSATRRTSSATAAASRGARASPARARRPSAAPASRHTRTASSREPAGRERFERQPREELVAPRREAEGDHEVAEPVQLGGPTAAAGAAEVGGQKARLLELGEVHAGHIGVQPETLRDLGDRDVLSGTLGDGPIDVVPGIVGQHCRQLVIAVHAPPSGSSPVER